MRHLEIADVIIGIADNGHPINAYGDGRSTSPNKIIQNNDVGVFTGAGDIITMSYPEFPGSIITKGNDRQTISTDGDGALYIAALII